MRHLIAAALASLTLSAMVPIARAQLPNAQAQVVAVTQLNPEVGTDRELPQFTLDRFSDNSNRVRFAVAGDAYRDGDLDQSLYVFVDLRTQSYRTFELYGPTESDPRIDEYLRAKAAARQQLVSWPRDRRPEQLIGGPQIALASSGSRSRLGSAYASRSPHLDRQDGYRRVSSTDAVVPVERGLPYLAHGNSGSQWSGFCWGEASAYLQARDPVGIGLADSGSWANANTQVVNGVIVNKLSWGANYANPYNPTSLGTHWYMGFSYGQVQTGNNQSWGRAFLDAVMWNTDFGSVVTGGILPDLYTQVEHWTDAYTSIEDSIHYADQVGYRNYGYSYLLHFYTYLHAAGGCSG